MSIQSKKIKPDFYQRQNVVQISRDLLGKVLVTRIAGQKTAGIIVETEAYRGITDRASHAFNARRTNRTKIMYRAGGIAYVYLIYGLHVLFNVITNVEGLPDAVLIRAVEPIEGIDVMLKRRNLKTLKPKVSNGPGKLTEALGITMEFNGFVLTGEKIWIEERNVLIPQLNISQGKRIGVDYAQADAHRPWRFWIKDNPFVSIK